MQHATSLLKSQYSNPQMLGDANTKKAGVRDTRFDVEIYKIKL